MTANNPASPVPPKGGSSSGLIGRTLVLALAIIAAETLHGTLRQWLLAPAVGDLRARQLSIISGSALILAVVWLMHRWVGAYTRRQCAVVGALLVLLVVAFEVTLAVTLGYTWARITQDYNPARGGFMLLGLAWLAAAPWVVSRLRGTHPPLSIPS